ncbi:DUF4167 domain-containing protein [Aureimonas endophytica]|nr:DUF4167 domain-containing protein [Aureimonas endophytica]
MRGRGRKGPNPLSRSYESNGPDVKIRGNAQHIAEKYIALARDATASGDRVMAENYLQHAEHYGRIVAAAQGSFQLQREEPDVFDGEYEDGDEDMVPEGAMGPNGHPYPVPERAQGERPQMQGQGQNRDNRDYGNGNRDQNRDYQNNRDGGGRDNREQRFDRNNDRQDRGERQDRNRDRNFNRDNRDRNRDNRQEGGERRAWEGRERQNWQDRSAVPNGLGPQPSVGEPPAGEETAPRPQSFEDAPRREERFTEAQHQEPVTTSAVTEQESGFGQAPAAREVLVEPEGAILSGDEAAPAERETRRRGRPRRARYGEGETIAAEEAAAPVQAPAVEAPAPAAESEAPSEAAAEAPAKRRPGRPRKKKADAEAEEGGTDHLPDFLLASNG